MFVSGIHESANPGSLRELKDVLPVAARALGLTVRSWEIQGSDGFEKIFAALSKDRPDGLYVTTSPLMTANLKRTVGFALKSRLPSVGSNIQYVEAGGANLVRRGPRGQLPARGLVPGQNPQGRQTTNLPVEQPSKFELVMNLKTAKQIGLAIPPNVLARADKVIK